MLMAGIEATRRRVRQHLETLALAFHDTDDGLRIDAGTTAVFISVEEDDGRSIVLLHAPVLADVDPSPEQLCALLGVNAGLRFGKFSWNADARIVSVEYEMLGDTLDPEELGVALRAVSDIADKSDEKLVRLFGGRMPLSHARRV